MAAPFDDIRRQVFARESYVANQQEHYRLALKAFHDQLQSPDNDSEDNRRLTWAIADTQYNSLSLRYTAGEEILPLRAELEDVVESYEQYAAQLRAHEQSDTAPPFSFDLLYGYTRCQQLLGLCYLLRREDLLSRVAALQDPNYAGLDLFYEEFLDYGLGDRLDTDTMYHVEPYQHLYDAMYADSKDESLRDIETFLGKWYKLLKNAPWHDTHLTMKDSGGAYFGYWSFEAGAVAYLLDLDDTGIEHMVYPRDLVAWAKENEHLPLQSDPHRLRGRCEAGEPCPRKGWWFTPAKVGSRRHFELGEVMPEFKSDWGSTIWQWDVKQT